MHFYNLSLYNKIKKWKHFIQQFVEQCRRPRIESYYGKMRQYDPGGGEEFPMGYTL